MDWIVSNHYIVNAFTIISYNTFLLYRESITATPFNLLIIPDNKIKNKFQFRSTPLGMLLFISISAYKPQTTTL